VIEAWIVGILNCPGISVQAVTFLSYSPNSNLEITSLNFSSANSFVVILT